MPSLSFLFCFLSLWVPKVPSTDIWESCAELNIMFIISQKHAKGDIGIIKGYKHQASSPGYRPVVFREHAPMHCSDGDFPWSEAKPWPYDIHKPRQALALLMAKFKSLCPAPADGTHECFLCIAFNDLEWDPPQAQQGTGKVWSYGDKHCVEGARNGLVAMQELMSQKLLGKETGTAGRPFLVPQ